jgi:hypothetical protein
VRQPTLGLVSTSLAIATALAFISLFTFDTFVSWVSFVLLSFIPMQVVVVVIWGGQPPLSAHLRQPAKGLRLVAATMAAAAVAAPLVLYTIGEGAGPPGPIPSHFAVIAVPITFWLAIMFGGWPFTRLLRHPVLAGLALLAGAYVTTYVIFRLGFDYAALRGTPVFLASAPTGAFDAVMALVFIVTALAVMFVVLCFDLWPFTAWPAAMRQPVLGLVWTLTALAGAALAMGLGIGVAGLDPMVFLTQVTVPFIFGTIVVLNMLQNRLFARRTQPLRGVLNVAMAAFAGSMLAQLYGALAPVVTGVLPSGAPGYAYELWIANALLSVTFPLLIFHAACFGYWPLVREAEPRPADTTPAAT